VLGAAIEAACGVVSSAHGYAAMWPVTAIPVQVSTLLLRKTSLRSDA
jgi:hypothetical protein